MEFQYLRWSIQWSLLSSVFSIWDCWGIWISQLKLYPCVIRIPRILLICRFCIILSRDCTGFRRIWQFLEWKHLILVPLLWNLCYQRSGWLLFFISGSCKAAIRRSKRLVPLLCFGILMGRWVPCFRWDRRRLLQIPPFPLPSCWVFSSTWSFSPVLTPLLFHSELNRSRIWGCSEGMNTWNMMEEWTRPREAWESSASP